MNPDIKPLLANLKRLDFDNYIHSNSFQHALLEVNADESWKGLLDKNGFNKDENAFDKNVICEKSFSQLLEYRYNDYWDFDQFIIPIVKDFIAWKGKGNYDVADLLASIKKSGVTQNTVDDLHRQLKLMIAPESTVRAEAKSNDKVEIKDEINRKDIFIVHGHDKISKLELKEILKDEFSLNPIILQDKPSDTLSTIFSKLDTYARKCPTAIILMTPDDEINGKKQARPNVLIEFGYFLGLFPLKDRKIIILRKKGCEIASDIAGVERYDFIESVEEVRSQLEKQFKHWNLI